MDNLVKQRVIGAVVLVALAVIFVPMLLESPEEALGPVGSNLPVEPELTVRDRFEPLVLPEPPPESEPAQVVLDAAPAEVSDPAAPGAEPLPPAGAPEIAPTAPAEAGLPPAAAVPAVQPAPAAPAEPAPAAPALPAAPAPEAAAAPAVTAKASPVAPPTQASPKPLSGWVVQLAALSSKDNALALRERLRGMGYTAFVEETKTAQGTQYRVRVGPELERSNADDLRARLEQQVQIKGMVMRYP